MVLSFRFQIHSIFIDFPLFLKLNLKIDNYQQMKF